MDATGVKLCKYTVTFDEKTYNLETDYFKDAIEKSMEKQLSLKRKLDEIYTVVGKERKKMARYLLESNHLSHSILSNIKRNSD